MRSTIRFLDDDTVQVSGCALAGLICKTKMWHPLPIRAPERQGADVH
jgi:uncharacterized protein (DUF2147 family)